MSSRLTRQSSSPSRVLSLLTAAILMAGSAPLMAAAADGQPAPQHGRLLVRHSPSSRWCRHSMPSPR